MYGSAVKLSVSRGEWCTQRCDTSNKVPHNVRKHHEEVEDEN